MSQVVQPTSIYDKMLRVTGTILVATVWTSALIFGLYILAFYAAALFDGDVARWNKGLPNLYNPEQPAATIGIGVHFAAGGVILILGCIQLLEKVRARFPAFHRWTGRVYIVACLLTSIGGLVFIFLQGTVGGTVMSIAFGLYGILMFVAAVETMRHAMARRIEQHRAWSLRLFALAIGSWLYRMDYGLWIFLMGGVGMKDFFGPFDYFMDFWFYVPNLVVAEVFIAKYQLFKSPIMKVLASLIVLIAIGLLALATYFFTKHYWSPPIIDFFVG